jgi:hypothetical protein
MIYCIYEAVQRKLFWAALVFGFVCIISCTTSSGSAEKTVDSVRKVPTWVTNLNAAFPAKDWVAVSASSSSQRMAESAAMEALARAYKTDIASLTQTSQQFSQIVNDVAGKKSISFDQSQDYSQQINLSTNMRGLIGVQTDMFQASDDTIYVVARMNRKECAARYSEMIRENTAIIDKLLSMAGSNPATFESYAFLGFAYNVAQITDNFQNILEVLDPSAFARKPAYGGANAIKTKMLECAARITIGIDFNTEQDADKTLFARAAGSFFSEMGFKTNEQGIGTYILRANVRFEAISQQNIVSSRYFFDAALENSQGIAIFSFTDDDRKAHPNNESEARRLAVRAAEMCIKEGAFASEFDVWLNSLLD